MKTLYRGIETFLSLDGVIVKDGRYIQESDLGIIKSAAFIIESTRAGNKLLWCGPEKKIPKQIRPINKEIKLSAATVLPAFVECHTHTVFAGSRAAEFELRNQGVSYQEIAKRGGGILSTMRHTRQASLKELTSLAQKRANRFLKQGVSTLEIKSGYGLDLPTELKMLEAAQQIKNMRVFTTYLGAHAIPKDTTADQYIEFMIAKVLPVIKKKKLSQRVDIFIENGFFSPEQARRYLGAAKEMGFEILIHADQLSLSGGTELAVEMSAMSADHVIQIKKDQIQKIARSTTTAVMLPSADLYMKCAYPPARELIEAGARVALATDFNPGSSPTQDLSLTGLLARLEMKMTLPEVIAAYTYNAWKALSSESYLSEKSCAEFICSDTEWTDFFYSAGQPMAQKMIVGSKVIDLNKIDA